MRDLGIVFEANGLAIGEMVGYLVGG